MKTQSLSVKVYAIAQATYTCTNPISIEDQHCDIYFPTSEGCSDREDIGAEDYHYSVEGKDEMVLVDKGLLEALVDECQRLSENNAVYDDSRNKSYNYADLNMLVKGMKFPDEVTNN